MRCRSSALPSAPQKGAACEQQPGQQQEKLPGAHLRGPRPGVIGAQRAQSERPCSVRSWQHEARNPLQSRNRARKLSGELNGVQPRPGSTRHSRQGVRRLSRRTGSLALACARLGVNLRPLSSGVIEGPRNRAQGAVGVVPWGPAAAGPGPQTVPCVRRGRRRRRRGAAAATPSRPAASGRSCAGGACSGRSTRTGEGVGTQLPPLRPAAGVSLAARPRRSAGAPGAAAAGAGEPERVCFPIKRRSKPQPAKHL